MNVLYVSGSPRNNSNTDILLNMLLKITGGKFIKLSDYNIDPCKSCWACQNTDKCVINDDMSNKIIPLLLECDCIVLGSPVYFNNVSAQLKTFIDRTWCLKGQLRNKIGASVVVGRKYGSEGAINAINSFYLKHEIIIANRGICGVAFKENEILEDDDTIASTKILGERIIELYTKLNKNLK